MPIGPSHGSRGGGSSFGGGSRSSGGSRRSSSSSGGNLLGSIIGGVIGGMLTAGARRRRREMYSGGDGGAYEAGPATPSRRRPTKYLVWAIVFAIFASITMSFRTLFVSSMKECNTYLATIEADYKDYYKPMIDAVQGYTTPASGSVDCGNGYYKTVATFGATYTSYKDNPTTIGAYLFSTEGNISYYFIVYGYYDVNYGYTTGTTYAQFSANQYQSMGREIEIAYYSKAGSERYSINTSYTNYETAEYKHYQETAEGNKKGTTNLLIVFIVELAVIALFVFLYIKKLKKYKQLVREDEAVYQQKQQAEAQEAQARAEEAQRIAKSKGRVCRYCGVDVPDGADACPGCGSRDFE